MPRIVPTMSGPMVSSRMLADAGMYDSNSADSGASGRAPTISGYSCSLTLMRPLLDALGEPLYGRSATYTAGSAERPARTFEEYHFSIMKMLVFAVLLATAGGSTPVGSLYVRVQTPGLQILL